MENLTIILCVLVLISILLIIIFRPKSSPDLANLQYKIDGLHHILSKMEASLKEDFLANRQEIASIAKENRLELNSTLKDIKSELTGTLREKFSKVEEQQNRLIDTTEKKLEQMRETVDEKLSKTLNERLSQSFEQVSKHLETVQKGIGEMQSLAIDVGGLKKVLSNVKMRGGVGEIQLAMLLEQMLAPNQYEANVKTKLGSSDSVEFAIKLPGREENEKTVVYLPIDAKFPKDAYETLIHAYENAIPDDIDSAIKNMENTIRKMARDIRDKYIDPPNTTDFALMFLPFESIYAEVIRRSALIDQLQNEYKITVVGPTILAAYLNSLQMGFRTLALQKRSSEVWQILGAVKSEFNKFGGLLEKAQKNLHLASDTVDELLGKRTRAISRKLKGIELMPEEEVQKILPDIVNGEMNDEDID
jgi:DNA recombination protein RmuC